MISKAKLIKVARLAKLELRQRMTKSAAFSAFHALSRDGERTAMTNILGLGYGAREKGTGYHSGAFAVRVYVRSKLPLSELRSDDVIPSDLNGTATDVIPVGDLAAQARPAFGGSSVGHIAVNAGTLGCVVTKRLPGAGRFILSNNHILANANDGRIGDTIVEPGPLDGGTELIARLHDFEALRFDGLPNAMDAAIAELAGPEQAKAEVRSIGEIPTNPLTPSVYQSVRKSGRTTQHTVGVVMHISADVSLRYGNRIAAFEDLIAIQGLGDPFSDRGDSGSLVVDGVTRRPVGLLIGGSAKATFACPIQLVLDRFGVDIANPD
jgi:hypothetical protein